MLESWLESFDKWFDASVSTSHLLVIGVVIEVCRACDFVLEEGEYW